MSTVLNDFGPPIAMTLARKTGRQYQLTTVRADGLTPQDMTGAQMSFEVAAQVDSSDVMMVKTILNGGIVYADVTTGVGVLTIDPPDIADITVFKSGVAYQWSLILKLIGIDPTLEANGTFTVIGTA